MQRELQKLRPITMMAPAAENTEADTMTVLTDHIEQKFRFSMKDVFVTRNEFIKLQEIMPNQTVHLQGQIDEVHQRNS
jgi:hypothetical protein